MMRAGANILGDLLFFNYCVLSASCVCVCVCVHTNAYIKEEKFGNTEKHEYKIGPGK